MAGQKTTHFMTTLRQLFFVALLVCAPAFLSAKQLNHGIVDKFNGRQFNYVFTDWQFRQQNLSFTIPSITLKKSDIKLPPFNNETMLKYATNDMQMFIKKPQYRNISYEIKPSTNGYAVSVRGRGITQKDMDAFMSDLEKIQGKSFKKYLKDHYLTTHPHNAKLIIPDYPQVVAAFTPSMKDVARQIALQTRGADHRDQMNYALNFLQSIPYHDFKDQNPPVGTGYATPPQMLALNKGDCESKTIAAATIFKSMMHNPDMVVVIVPEHVLLGIKTRPQQNDKTIHIDGKTYVLAEPTGERILPLGQIDERSLTDIEAGNFITQKL